MLLEKVVVAILSAITFSALLALTFLWGEEETGWNFLSLFIIYFIYSSPVYLLGGAPYSALVDIFLDPERIGNKYLKYIAGFIAYAIGGLVIMGIWLLITTNDWNSIDLINGALLGVFAALVFFHLTLAWRKLMDFA